MRDGYFFCYLEPAITKIIATKKEVTLTISHFPIQSTACVPDTEHIHTDCPSRFFLSQISQLQLSDKKKSVFPNLFLSFQKSLRMQSKTLVKTKKKLFIKFWVGSDSNRNDFHIT